MSWARVGVDGLMCIFYRKASPRRKAYCHAWAPLGAREWTALADMAKRRHAVGFIIGGLNGRGKSRKNPSKGDWESH